MEYRGCSNIGLAVRRSSADVTVDTTAAAHTDCSEETNDTIAARPCAHVTTFFCVLAFSKM